MKTRVVTLIGGGLALAMAAMTIPTSAQQAAPPTSNRVALVIGEGAYGSGGLPAAPNDAGLVAETLAGAGFDVTGARDLDGDGLRGAVRDFLAKAGAAGPDGIAVVYLAGRALQFDGDNYFEPVGSRLARPSDVPIETLRLGDFDRALAALPIQAKVVVVDGAYAGPPAGLGLPPGLALVEAEQGELLAFNTAPGTEAPKTAGNYGTYAQSLVQAMKQGGAPVEDVFDRLRLAVETATSGVVVPYDSDKLTRSFKFFDRAANAPLVDSAQIPFSALQRRPLRDFPADQAYDVVIARDTLPAYAEFLTAFPDSPLVRRVRLLQAIRREALFWNAAIRGGTPPAFWTYLARYPKGPHAPEARRRLSRLAVASRPPPNFAPLAFRHATPARSGDRRLRRTLHARRSGFSTAASSSRVSAGAARRHDTTTSAKTAGTRFSADPGACGNSLGADLRRCRLHRPAPRRQGRLSAPAPLRARTERRGARGRRWRSAARPSSRQRRRQRSVRTCSKAASRCGPDPACRTASVCGPASVREPAGASRPTGSSTSASRLSGGRPAAARSYAGPDDPAGRDPASEARSCGGNQRSRGEDQRSGAATRRACYKPGDLKGQPARNTEARKRRPASGSPRACPTASSAAHCQELSCPQAHGAAGGVGSAGWPPHNAPGCEISWRCKASIGRDATTGYRGAAGSGAGRCSAAQSAACSPEATQYSSPARGCAPATSSARITAGAREPPGAGSARHAAKRSTSTGPRISGRGRNGQEAARLRTSRRAALPSLIAVAPLV